MAAPLSDTSGMQKRVPDVDQEITDDGNLPAYTTALWDSPDDPCDSLLSICIS
ncbi:hypothetical protein K449DRAFT_437438 [Hypoxylon sp. EC38]|nr:hypothetical protein K449DRAFT_437438 [Hypoxylon sp. EC38]